MHARPGLSGKDIVRIVSINELVSGVATMFAGPLSFSLGVLEPALPFWTLSCVYLFVLLLLLGAFTVRAQQLLVSATPASGRPTRTAPTAGATRRMQKS